MNIKSTKPSLAPAIDNCSSTKPAAIRRGAIEAAFILCAVLAIQFAAGAYHRDLAADPDEAAHFVTGVMVYDYLTTAPGSSPMRFAEEYYLRYSKVAIGHWPPGFYALQGIWYALVGASKTSATVLIGLISGGLAWCLYRRLAPRHGAAVALVTVAVFLAQPLVRSHSMLIMSDMAACLGVFLAALAFSDFLQFQGRRQIAWFVFWSSLTIITKPAALTLALFVPICILVTRQWAVLKSWKLWTAGAAIGMLTAPYYLWTWSLGMGLHSHGSVGGMISASVRTGRSRGSDTLLSLASVWLVAVFVIGCLSVAVARRRPSTDPESGRFDIGAAIALCMATILFLFFAPVFSSPRYFFPVLVGMMILYACGLEALLDWIPGPKQFSWVIVSCLAIMAVATAPGRVPTPVNGYAAAAESFGASQPGRVMLISSNSIGDGAFMVERLLRDRDRSEFVLRASKVLEKSGWSGGNYSVRFSTLDQLRGFLDSVPVHFLVIDDFGYRNDTGPPSHKLLKELLEESTEQFPLVDVFSVNAYGRRYDDAIRIYENRSARGRQMIDIELDMKTSLGRTLRLGSGDLDNADQ